MARAWAPGRVNLIGDHTDYTGGLVLPMAIDLGTTIDWVRDSASHTSTFRSDVDDLVVSLADKATATGWGKYVHAVADLVTESHGHHAPINASVSTTLPVGAGLSSSASLEVAVALALGARADTHDERVGLARLCQLAEQHAVGVPCGIMDQLIVLTGDAGAAQLIDCHSLGEEPVPMPDDVQVVVRFVAHRTLKGSEYSERVSQCSACESKIGPLRLATRDDTERISDDTLRRRARHVVTENERVRDFAFAMRRGDYARAGALMRESHESLDIDFEVSTEAMNAEVAELMSTPGVFGARMTGGGFGGCVVALARADVDIDGWRVTASRGAHVID